MSSLTLSLLDEINNPQWKGIRLVRSHRSNNSDQSIIELQSTDDDNDVIPPTVQSTLGRPSIKSIERILFPSRIPINCLGLSESCCCCLLEFIESDDEQDVGMLLIDYPNEEKKEKVDCEVINCISLNRLSCLKSASSVVENLDENRRNDTSSGSTGFLNVQNENIENGELHRSSDRNDVNERNPEGEFRILLSSECEGHRRMIRNRRMTEDDKNLCSNKWNNNQRERKLSNITSLTLNTETSNNQNEIGFGLNGINTGLSFKSNPSLSSSFIKSDDPRSWIGLISSCNHGFHFECIIRWAARENTCPQCKARFRVIGVYDRKGRRLRYRYVKKINQQPAYHEEEGVSELSDPGDIRNPCFICQQVEDPTGNSIMNCEGWYGHCDESCHRDCLGLEPREEKESVLDFFCPTCIRKNRCVNSDGEHILDGRALTASFQLPSVQDAPTETLALSPTVLQLFLDLYRHLDTHHVRTPTRGRRAPRRSRPSGDPRRVAQRRRRAAASRPRRTSASGQASLVVSTTEHQGSAPEADDLEATFHSDDGSSVSPVVPSPVRHRLSNLRRRRQRTTSETADEARILQDLYIDDLEQPVPPPMRGVPSDFTEYEEFERQILGHISYGTSRYASRREDGGVASGLEFLAGLLESSGERNNHIGRRQRQQIREVMESRQGDDPPTMVKLSRTWNQPTAREQETVNEERRKRRRVEVRDSLQSNQVVDAVLSQSTDSSTTSSNQTSLADAEVLDGRSSSLPFSSNSSSSTRHVPDSPSPSPPQPSPNSISFNPSPSNRSIDNHSRHGSSHSHRERKVIPSSHLISLVKKRLRDWFILNRDQFRSLCQQTCESLVHHHRHYLRTSNRYQQDEFWRMMDSALLHRKMDDTIQRRMQRLDIQPVRITNDHVI